MQYMEIILHIQGLLEMQNVLFVWLCLCIANVHDCHAYRQLQSGHHNKGNV